MKYYCYAEYKGTKQSYFFTDESKNILCKAELIKMSLFKPDQFEFTNYKNNGSQIFGMGKCIEIETGFSIDENHRIGTVDSYFKIDGVNCWDYIADMGYEIDRHLKLSNLGYSYDIYKDGVCVGYIETAGRDVYSDPSQKDGLIKEIPFLGNYRIDCEEDLYADMFMLCFCLNRSKS